MLAAGVLGTVDLLLAARDNAWLPGVSGAVGKRVRTNSETIVAATARGKGADFTEGVAITSSIYPDEITHIEPVRYPRGADLIGWLARPLTDGGPGASRPLRFLAACFARPGDFARSLLPFWLGEADDPPARDAGCRQPARARPPEKVVLALRPRAEFERVRHRRETKSVVHTDRERYGEESCRADRRLARKLDQRGFVRHPVHRTHPRRRLCRQRPGDGGL